MTKKPKNQFSELAIYQAKDGAIELRLDKKNETILANINQVAELFGVQKAAISKHLNNIFKEGELKKASTVSILETVAPISNSPLANMFFKCLEIAAFWTAKTSAI